MGLIPRTLKRYQYKDTAKTRIKPDPSEGSKGFFIKGEACLKNENYKKAIEYYSKAMQLNPSDGIAPYKRGIAKIMLNDFPGMYEDHKIARNLHPSYFRSQEERRKRIVKKHKVDLFEAYKMLIRSSKRLWSIDE